MSKEDTPITIGCNPYTHVPQLDGDLFELIALKSPVADEALDLIDRHLASRFPP